MNHLFIGIILALSQSIVAAQDPPARIQESPPGVAGIGYRSVAAALESVKSIPGVTVRVTEPDGWTVVNDPKANAIWSFAPVGHYAYPAVVRREVKSRNGSIYLEMGALCEAEKEPCDKLIREFQLLNERMTQSMRNRGTGKNPP